MGEAYVEMMIADPDRLRAQLQAYAACDDPESARSCATATAGSSTRRVEGRAGERVSQCFAYGMLFNVVTMMGLQAKPRAVGGRMVDGLQHKR